jgi:hypothetical protein
MQQVQDRPDIGLVWESEEVADQAIALLEAAE